MYPTTLILEWPALLRTRPPLAYDLKGEEFEEVVWSPGLLEPLCVARNSHQGTHQGQQGLSFPSH